MLRRRSSFLTRSTAVIAAAAMPVAGLAIAQPAAGVDSAVVRPAAATYPATQYAVIKTIAVGLDPVGVAVNHADDTVYVANTLGNSVSVINGRTGVVSSTVSGIGTYPENVAVHQQDDSVFVTSRQGNSVTAINGRTNTAGSSTTVGLNPIGVAVRDDSVFVANRDSGSVSIVDARSLAITGTISGLSQPFGVAVNAADANLYVTNLNVGRLTVIDAVTGAVDDSIVVQGEPTAVAVHQLDDTVYVTNRTSNTVSIINGTTRSVARNASVGPAPWGIAVDQDSRAVFVANTGSNYITILNGRSGDLDDTIVAGSTPAGVAIDESGTNAGLVYVTNFVSNDVSVIGTVTPTTPTSAGSAGDTVTLTLDVPNLAAGYVMDAGTIEAVSFGANAGTALTRVTGQNQWTIVAPVGTAGSTVDINVRLKGGLWATAGTFTYGAGAPTVTGISPTSGSTAGGTSVTVTGSNFVAGASVAIGGVSCDDTSLTGSTQITCTTGARAAGVVDVVVTNPGPISVTGAGLFTYVAPAPTVASISPASGSTAGGTSVTVTGTDFVAGAAVAIGGVSCDDTSLTGSTQILCTTGARAAGVVDVVVTNPDAQSGTGAGLFTYLDPPIPPVPADPASPPLGAAAVAGNAQATVRWSPPSSPGSFPVTTYRVTAAPGGQSCLVAAPTLTCTVAALTNGIAYTFTVQALNGAGWSAPSLASPPVTPSPGPAPAAWITLDQGTRTPAGRLDRITTVGDTGAMEPGTRLTPWIRFTGQQGFTQGRATIIVQSDGTFAWTRLIGTSRGLVAYVSWTDVESNRVRWAKVR